jgi:hypothetical protein
LEDGSSVRKKTEKEEEEDKKIAEAVNRTLIEEEKKKAEEEKKKMTDVKKTGGQEDGNKRTSVEKQEGQDEACLPANCSCPIVEPCPKEKECPAVECGPCPGVDPCKDCPKPVEQDCPPCQPCRPCGPCPVNNTTHIPQDCPSPPVCPETSGLSVPVAMVVGASISLVTLGAAAVVGLFLRYVPPLISGILFLSIVCVVWFLSSHYPDVARDMGGRVATLLREAAETLGHRVMEAIQRHQEQVCVPSNSTLSYSLI